jgi:hypothetical protein
MLSIVTRHCGDATTVGAPARQAIASERRPIRWARVAAMSTFHEFEMTSITGDQVSFDQFEGQICLIVNVASA